MPLVLAIQRHVLAAERSHADDTTVPVLAKDKTRIGRPSRVLRRAQPRWRIDGSAVDGCMSGTTGHRALPDPTE
jgi:hypothetical protein